MSLSQTASPTAFNQLQFNMIEQQVRPWDVLDQRILDLLKETPRELFVPEAYQSLAYADITIPLGHEQLMLEPRVEARLLQALDISKLDNILEIGTGSGFTTSFLARLGRSVTSVDYFDDFLTQAEARLNALNINNVVFKQGCAAAGWDAAAYEYDVILINATLPSVPDAFLPLLNRGGRLALFTGAAPTIEATLVRKMGSNDYHRKKLFETDVPPLLNLKHTQTFVF